MTEALATAHADLAGLSHFCQELFGSLPRSDQRRWGEVYVRGLLTVAGRKSIRRIAEQVVGRPVDQSLQQFVNQSPWRWEEVRRALAHRVAELRPRAWLVREAMFPKNGDSSVGVARQYVGSAGRTVNCQLGLTVLAANEHAGCAVNWRLMLPRSWDTDTGRRQRVRLPVSERHLPRWRHVLGAVDELRAGWGLRPAPVLVDAEADDATSTMRGLAERGLPYLVRVPEQTAVLPERSATGCWRMLTAGELAELSARRQVVLWRRPRPDGPATRTHFSVVSICDTCPGGERVRALTTCHHVGTRRVLAAWSWSPGVRRLEAVWLTNLVNAQLPDLIRLVELDGTAELSALRDDFGLQDFEGRSFAGWHHHVTLVSAAHAFRTLGVHYGQFAQLNWRRAHHGDQGAGAVGGVAQRRLGHPDRPQAASGTGHAGDPRRAARHRPDAHRGAVGYDRAAVGRAGGADLHLALASAH